MAPNTKPPRISAQTLSDQLSLTPGPEPDTFRTRFLPERMGNMGHFAYGGCALGVGVQAACETVSQGYRPYSMSGSFLAPVSIDILLECSVRRVRDTRTFATRLVEILQVQPQKEKDGNRNGESQRRLCMILLADFHKEGEGTLLDFSAPPDRTYSGPEASLTPQEIARNLADSKTITPETESAYNTLFGLMARHFETRQAPEGIGAQNLTGMAKRQPTTQDHLPLTSKTTADWVRCRTPLRNSLEHYAGLAFVLDGYLSFLAGMHNHMFLDDAAACASLDFSVRVFSNDFDLTQWNLREMKTVAGGEGRTYSEARLWNGQGRLVANMTQQSILRPFGKTKAAL
ncbi:thioesterase-like superfamily-domain-containing protein [Aspergillus carlsbadensis]|nr:thioesterase-like superfamily-domain-containing protein [Aspergillus carlsbadensis]